MYLFTHKFIRKYLKVIFKKKLFINTKFMYKYLLYLVKCVKRHIILILWGQFRKYNLKNYTGNLVSSGAILTGHRPPKSMIDDKGKHYVILLGQLIHYVMTTNALLLLKKIKSAQRVLFSIMNHMKSIETWQHRIY